MCLYGVTKAWRGEHLPGSQPGLRDSLQRDPELACRIERAQLCHQPTNPRTCLVWMCFLFCLAAWQDGSCYPGLAPRTNCKPVPVASGATSLPHVGSAGARGSCKAQLLPSSPGPHRLRDPQPPSVQWGGSVYSHSDRRNLGILGKAAGCGASGSVYIA